MHMSNYLKTSIINCVFRGIPYSAPPKVYLALYTSDPTDADTGTETTYGDYARQEITFPEDVDGVTSNTIDVLFPAVASGTPTITHIGIRDALTDGNLLCHAPLTIPRALKAGKHFIVTVGKTEITFD